MFELADTGAGLTAEECERLFTPYYTTKQHGTGLGLAIAQSVISDHKGRITRKQQKGPGNDVSCGAAGVFRREHCRIWKQQELGKCNNMLGSN